MTLESSVLTPGARVAGRYVVEQLVRRAGAMSVYVARADNASTARFVARVIGGEGGAPDAVAAVNRELQRVAMLRQRAVPTLVAVARDAAGLVVLTERPEGQSLRDHLEKSGRMRPNEVARVIAEVAMVLDALHAATPPIVHRAVTPDTIAIAERMLRVWVEECGLAQALTAAGLLASAAWPAPVAYLSPAELAGAPSAATDVFSLASVAYECIVGAAAFRRDSDVETEALVRSGVRPSAAKERADITPDVDTVLQRAWSNEGVYATAGAFARELSRVLLTNPTTRASVPIVAKPRVPAGKEGGALVRSGGNKSTLLGMAPGATSPGDAAGGNPLKSTLLGMGIPRAKDRAPAGSSPRAAPHLLPPTAPPGSRCGRAISISTRHRCRPSSMS